MRFVFCLLWLLPLLLGCDAPQQELSALLAEPAISLKVDPVSGKPIDPADLFAPSADPLYASIRVDEPAENVVLSVLLSLKGQDDVEMARQSVTAREPGHVNFVLSPPAGGWPAGNYEAQFFLGDEKVQSLLFAVSEPQGQAVASGSADTGETEPAALQGSHKLFRDYQFGFQFELPRDWTFEVTEEQDYLFTGQEPGDSAEMAIVVRIVDTRTRNGGSLEDEMNGQLDLVSGAPEGEILKKGTVMVDGRRAPYFLATYHATDTSDREVLFGHTQLGLENGPVILLFSYFAPREIYQDNVAVFQHLVDTTELGVVQP